MTNHLDCADRITVAGDEALSQVLSGMLDVIIAFGCVMAEASTIERADIVAAMDAVLAQQHARDGGEATPATQFAAKTLRRFFSRPVVGRAGVVN